MQSGRITNGRQVSLSFPRCSHRHRSSSQPEGQTVTRRGHGSTAKKNSTSKPNLLRNLQIDSPTQKIAGDTGRSALKQPVTITAGAHHDPRADSQHPEIGTAVVEATNRGENASTDYGVWGYTVIFIGVGSIFFFYEFRYFLLRLINISCVLLLLYLETTLCIFTAHISHMKKRRLTLLSLSCPTRTRTLPSSTNFE